MIPSKYEISYEEIFKMGKKNIVNLVDHVSSLERKLMSNPLKESSIEEAVILANRKFISFHPDSIKLKIDLMMSAYSKEQ